ncbi:type IX secretion system motor protein PorM/GldM [Geofilum rhodophaeum]|uniref:type IX secretion system motor protein PorM/GldM n=1 Tax=Geofilum rhodophaeum TaxID=1965019 RepID=UPI000B524062|nr:gliding motility protein GldM [Geofilum rhodophaeum]
MSGGNCPETPRQKMIGMMYLFLTAMLALNVSGELLNAFILVDRSIKQAKETVEAKNEFLYSDFAMAFETNKKKVGDNYQKSLVLRDKADELVNHIDSLKQLFVTTADGPEFTPDNYPSVSNQDIAPQIMITEKGQERSHELKRMIKDYRDLLLSYVDPADSALSNNINIMLSTEDPPVEDGVQKSWQSEKFEHLPLAASMALLSQIQTDVRNMESDVVRYLYTKVDEGSFKFNKIEPLVIPRSDYVIQGDEYYAEIMMAASDTTQPPVVTVEGKVLETVHGKGILKIPANRLGEEEWTGTIQIKNPDGTLRSESVSGKYIVSAPSVVISPTKMNVFYEGVDNPVSISVPGIPSESIIPRISSGQLLRRGSDYIVRPANGSSGKEVTISVSADVNGNTRVLGRQNFRIRRVPDPVAKVNNQREGAIGRNILLAQMGIVADMENFEFDLQFKVTEFTVATIRGGYVVDAKSNSNLFTDEQKELLRGTVRGQRVYIQDIQAVGPDGRRRSLGSIILTVD